jgi:hypothetical protein
MAKKKSRRKARKASNYCACPGVDAKTGRVLKGFRARIRGGGCPIPTKKTIAKFIGPRVPPGLRKAHRAAAAAVLSHEKVKSYTGSGYAEGYNKAQQRAQLNVELVKAGVSPLSGTRGKKLRLRPRPRKRR